jgi:adenosyl cobinamide kinase/adenosyl cobinamide phosphate guanylyltransferase
VITLVLGGARSGKSEVAEQLARSGGGDVVYLATAVLDGEDVDMAARVEAHRSRRPPSWRTVECGRELVDAVRAAPADATVLVDALGTWVASAPELDADAAALCDALAARRTGGGHTIVVSEEVGLGVHPSSEAGRRFRDVLGTCNRMVADLADRVLFVVAGQVLPLEKPG